MIRRGLINTAVTDDDEPLRIAQAKIKPRDAMDLKSHKAYQDATGVAINPEIEPAKSEKAEKSKQQVFARDPQKAGLVKVLMQSRGMTKAQAEAEAESMLKNR